jgi:hypothetical protein
MSIDQVMSTTTKKFADKGDTKKALKALEKQLKNIYELYITKSGNGSGDEGDDAMFSKKPLGGFSCASCEKKLMNLQTSPADYKPWGKFPFRDPNDRIARVRKLK